MSRPNPTTELKKRFISIRDKHLKRWKTEFYPEPEPPTADVLRKELKSAKFTIHPDHLRDGLRDEDSADYLTHPPFYKIIRTKSITAYLVAIEARKRALDAFEKLLDATMNTFQDRALFDHESGFLMLQDFEKWGQALPNR
jgi:hypothetical protein